MAAPTTQPKITANCRVLPSPMSDVFPARMYRRTPMKIAAHSNAEWTKASCVVVTVCA